MNQVQTSATKGDILVVDDIPENLHLLYTMLTESGYEVRRVINGKLALSAVETDPPELILLDIMMPGMDGYEVCRRLKASPQTQDIPIIFISAKGEVFDKVKAFELGGVDYITKPFQVEEVIARIENQLTIIRQQQQLKTQNLHLQQEVRTRLAREQALQLIVEGTVAHTGIHFFRPFVRCLAQALGVRYSLITEFIDDRNTQIRPLAFWQGEEPLTLTEYDILLKPCQQVLEGKICYYPEKVSLLFPHDLDFQNWGIESYLGIPLMNSDNRVIGHLVAMGDKPMQDDANRELILRIFAARASAELERQQYEATLVAAREAALEAAQAKSQFLATMSHEIRTPMNGVLGMTELLQKTPLNPQQLDFVNTLHSSSSNLLTIINDILDFSKLEAGEMQLEQTTFNLNQNLDDLIHLFSHQATAKGLYLTLYLDQEQVPQWLVGDIARLRQVLMNLIGNAIKFTPKGCIDVEVSQETINSFAATETLLTKLVDTEKFAKISLGDISFQADLLNTFVQDVHTYLEDIKALLSRQNFLEISRRAHQLKGGSATIALLKIPELAAQLETAAQEEQEDKISALIPPIEFHLEQIENLKNQLLTLTTPEFIKLLFTVRDTGIGIPPSSHNKLFQPFSQVDASTTRNYGGTGLGLAICKQLVEMMGGEIGVQSAVNQGSTFWFTAVFTPGTPPDSSTTLTPENTSNTDEMSLSIFNPECLVAKKLLVVDDNAKARQQILLTTSDWGMDVMGVASLKAALMTLRATGNDNDKTPYDFVLINQDQLIVNPVLSQLITYCQEQQTQLILLQAESLEPPQMPADFALASFCVKSTESLELQKILINALHQKSTLSFTRQLSPSGLSPIRRPSTRRILLVEDTLINQKVVLNQLDVLGYQADCVNNGQECLDRLHERQYDLILMDCQMPILDGYQTTKIIKEREKSQENYGTKTHETVIIGLTAYAMKHDRDKCLAAGMDDYLSKPVTLEVLDKMIHQWLPDVND